MDVENSSLQERVVKMGKMLSVALGFVLLTSLLLVPSGAAAAAQRIYEATRYIEEDFDGHTGVVACTGWFGAACAGCNRHNRHGFCRSMVQRPCFV